ISGHDDRRDRRRPGRASTSAVGCVIWSVAARRHDLTSTRCAPGMDGEYRIFQGDQREWGGVATEPEAVTRWHAVANGALAVIIINGIQCNQYPARIG